MSNFSTSHFPVLEFMEDNIRRAGSGWILFSLCLSVFPSVCLPFCEKIMQSTDLGTRIQSSVGRLLKLDMKDPWQKQRGLVPSQRKTSKGKPRNTHTHGSFFPKDQADLLGLCIREKMQPFAMILQNFLPASSGRES